MSKPVEFSGETRLVVEILRCQKVDISKKRFSYWEFDPCARSAVDHKLSTIRARTGKATSTIETAACAV